MALVKVPLTKDDWTPVATDVTIGSITLQDVNTGDIVYYTYVPTGDTAPDYEPLESSSLAMPFVGQYLPVNISTAIDIYLWTDALNIDAIVDLS